MDQNLDLQAENLINKIKHYLITMMGVTADEASDDEFYRAFSYTLREEIMINWTATFHTFKEKKPRILYYLCMEYMPGRCLRNNLVNMNAIPLVENLMKKMKRDFRRILALEPDPGLGNGGLGRLAACLLDSLATQEYPAVGYGLRYHYGIFDQELWNGKQVERPDTWLLKENPWEFRRDVNAVSVLYGGNAVETRNRAGELVHDLFEYDEVRALPYDIPIIGYKKGSDFQVGSLRLWSTKESPRNFELQRYNAGHFDLAAENTSLTDVLYPNDNNENGKRIRLKQEFLLASASLQDIIHHHIKAGLPIGQLPDKVRIQLNDTHPAIVIAEFIRILLQYFDFAWGPALDVVRTCCSFTNHTILKEALEEWNQHRIQTLFPRQYRIIERLNQQLCDEIRKQYPGQEKKVHAMSILEGGQVRMAHLAIYGSHKVNGVAALHSEILKKETFKDFYEMNPDKFINVTNGVTQRRWLLSSNPRLAQFITNRIGDGWITDFRSIANLAAFGTDRETLAELQLIKKENKEKLIEYLRLTNPIRDDKGNILSFTRSLGSDALFDVQIKRIHEYKRQLMNALHALILYCELKENPASRKIKRMILVGGKAAPGYYMAKAIIQLINAISRKVNGDPDVNDKLEVVYVENYNVSRAERMIPAADLSVQISTAGMEASGTGNMKLSMNGALTIGTEDGANVEMRQSVTDKWWPFSFGSTLEENNQMFQDRSYTSQEVYTHNPRIKQVLDMLKDRSLAQNESEHEAFSSIYDNLLSGNGQFADRYFVLKDLIPFYNTQKKVEELYSNPDKWAEYALHNIAGMGPFSIDESVHNYARLAWDLQRCPVDAKALNHVRGEYSEHDKCRILRVG